MEGALIERFHPAEMPSSIGKESFGHLIGTFQAQERLGLQARQQLMHQ